MAEWLQVLAEYDKTMKLQEMDFATYGTIQPYLTADSAERAAEVLEKAPRPSTFCGYPVPDNLNLITLGELFDIQDRAQQTDGVLAAVRVLFPKVDAAKMAREKVLSVVGLVRWIGREVERINTLFAKIQTRYTAEQISAGVKQLNFGAFGLLDWYAKRQGISNQDDVRGVCWVRVYTCMKMDNECAEYERRLNDVIARKFKTK